MQFLSVARTARPPRVAVLVPEPGLLPSPLDEVPWSVYIEGAIGWLSRGWGGEAGVVVAVGEEGIDEGLPRTLATYDPDYISVYAPSRHDAAAAEVPCRSQAQAEWVPDEVREELRLHLSAPDLDEPFDPGPAFRHGVPGGRRRASRTWRRCAEGIRPNCWSRVTSGCRCWRRPGSASSARRP